MEKETLEELQLAKECIEEAKTLFFENRLTEAATLATRAADLFLAHDCKFEGCEALNTAAITYNALSNENAEMECYLKGIEIARSNNYVDPLAGYYVNIGSKYQELGAKEQALSYFAKASELMDTEEGKKARRRAAFELILSMNLGELYADLGEMEEAKKHLEQGRLAMKNPENESYKFSFMAFESRLAWRLGEHEKIFEMLDKIFDFAINTEYTSDYIESMSDLFDLFADMQEYDKWKALVEKLEKVITKEGNFASVAKAQEFWMRYYTEIGDIEAYRDACQKYVEANMERKVNEDAEHVATLDMKIRLNDAAEQRKNAELLINFDSLTGIGSRNKMLKDSIEVINESAKNNSTITIGIIDIDFFKQCNDTYGHIEGDECLKKVANIIKDSVGDLGDVYRFGGDEFLIVMTGTEVSDIDVVGGRIKDGIAAAEIPNIKSPIGNVVTVSQGYTMAIAEEGDTIEKLVDLADCVLYRVKKAGRNGYMYMRYSDIIADLD